MMWLLAFPALMDILSQSVLETEVVQPQYGDLSSWDCNLTGIQRMLVRFTNDTGGTGCK